MIVLVLVLLVILIGVSLCAYRDYTRANEAEKKIGDLESRRDTRPPILADGKRYSYKVMDFEKNSIPITTVRRLLQATEFETRLDNLGKQYAVVIRDGIEPQVEVVLEMDENSDGSKSIPFDRDHNGFERVPSSLGSTGVGPGTDTSPLARYRRELEAQRETNKPVVLSAKPIYPADRYRRGFAEYERIQRSSWERYRSTYLS